MKTGMGKPGSEWGWKGGEANCGYRGEGKDKRHGSKGQEVAEESASESPGSSRAVCTWPEA